MLMVYSLVLLILLSGIQGAKLRSWLGPNMFVEGRAPAVRGIGQILAEDQEKVYVFGGTAGSTYLNDLHIYYSKSRTWADVSKHVQGMIPAPRYGHAFIAAMDKLYLFGGRSTSG